MRFMDMVLCLFREVTVILEKLNTTSSDLIQPGKHSNLSFLHSCNTNVVFSKSCGPHKFCWSAFHNLCRPEVWYVNNENIFVVIGREGRINCAHFHQPTALWCNPVNKEFSQIRNAHN